MDEPIAFEPWRSKDGPIEVDAYDGFVLIDGTHYGDMLSAILVGVLGLCGCGRPREVAAMVMGLLERVQEKGPYRWSVAEEFALHVLDDRGLLEHGVSVHCPWLTKRGESALALLRAELLGGG